MSEQSLFDYCAETTSSAVLSPDGVYRYSLARTWEPGKPVDLWVMLNPSIADASQDDPTIRRCVSFSKSWGAGGLAVVNLYAYRATDPKAMQRASAAGADVVGPDTDGWIDAHAKVTTGKIICAWGAHGQGARVRRVLYLLHGGGKNTVYALGFTKGGAPRHPLYLRADSSPFPILGVPSTEEPTTKGEK